MPEIRRGSAQSPSGSVLAGFMPPSRANTTGDIANGPVSSLVSSPVSSPLADPASGADKDTTDAGRDISKDAGKDTDADPSSDPQNTRPEHNLQTQSAEQVPGRGDRPNTNRIKYLPGRHSMTDGVRPGRTFDSSRRSLSYAQRDPASAYYDSRAATHREWKRRGETLQEYYDANPQLLPQLPFTWHHGRRRWRLFLFAVLVVIDAAIVPIALFYGLRFGGGVAGWIIFAVVTTIWGGPTYLELAVRSLRLIKKERFYRPLGTDSRWCFDMLTWASVLTVGVVTALFVIGSAPHIVFLRVLCMPAPAILYCLGGVLGFIHLFHAMDWPAPFRISSTAKGDKVLPGVYYFMEDVVAVNARAGRPYREALAARYQASPRFQRMLQVQSVFWSVPALVLAVALTVVAVIPPVPAAIAYGICWAVPFIWCIIWATIAIFWCKRDMVRERLEWEAGVDSGKGLSPRSEANVSV